MRATIVTFRRAGQCVKKKFAFIDFCRIFFKDIPESYEDDVRMCRTVMGGYRAATVVVIYRDPVIQ